MAHLYFVVYDEIEYVTRFDFTKVIIIIRVVLNRFNYWSVYWIIMLF